MDAGSVQRAIDDPDYFETIIASSPDCIRIIDLEGRVEFLNPGGRKMLGIEDCDSAVKGRHWADFWHGEQRVMVERALEAAARGETQSFRAYATTRSGRVLWLDTTVSPVYGGEPRAVQRLLASSRDVTEEVENRTLLDTILECVPAALFAKELDSSRVVFFNGAAENMLGVSAADVIGKTLRDIQSPEVAEHARRTDLEAAAGVEGVVLHHPGIGPNDQGRHMRTRKKASPPGLGARYVVCLMEDLTEERNREEALSRALEEAEAADRAKTEFLAVMGHEIRSPLNGVLGMAQAMEMDELSPVQRDRLKVVREAGGALLDLLNDLLDLSRINAGGLTLEEGEVDLSALGQAAQTLFDGLAAEKGLSFDLRVDPEAVGPWRGDPIRVRQIVTNLVSNAVKFTDQGQVGLAMRAAPEGFVLEVSDTGLGIAADQLERVFRPFDQLDRSATRRHGGSGLGLAICQRLAEMMGGDISVRSTPGQGSLFTVRLPLARAAPQASSEPPPPVAAPEAAALPRLKILAAEDNPTNQLVLRTLLQAVGLDAHIVANGQEAVDAWRREPWDLILMDVQMPVMDGRAATRMIRTEECAGAAPRTPIIGLTANAMRHQLEEYAACGMDSVVAKPIDIRALLEAIRPLRPAAAA